MDIFNCKRVKELERTLAQKDEEIDSLERKNKKLKQMLDDTENEMNKILKLKQTIPEDCTPGEYCRACEFAKPYVYHNYAYHSNRRDIITGHLCNKGESCGCFVQKEVED